MIRGVLEISRIVGYICCERQSYVASALLGSSSKRDSIEYFRTPCLTAAVATATRNQSRNSPVWAADDRVAPERNRRDSPLARAAPNARSALPDARGPSTAIIQSPMRGPISPTATPFPRISPSAKDRISRYVNDESVWVWLRDFDRGLLLSPVETHAPRYPLPVTNHPRDSPLVTAQRRVIVMEILEIVPGMNHATDKCYICLFSGTLNNLNEIRTTRSRNDIGIKTVYRYLDQRMNRLCCGACFLYNKMCRVYKNIPLCFYLAFLYLPQFLQIIAKDRKWST